MNLEVGLWLYLREILAAMKTNNLLLAFFFFISGNIQAQWTQKISGTTNDLYDIHFPTPDIGYAVGYKGTVLKSIDAGETWSPLSIGIASNLEAVRFLNADTGFTVGDSIIFKTTDGGANWSQTIIPKSMVWLRSLTDIKFINNQVGFCVGYGILLKTTDCGNTWNLKYSVSRWMSCISFPTPDTAYVTFSDGGWEFLKTVDGGETWNLDTIHSNFFDQSVLEAVYFTSGSTGFIGGWYDPALIKTTDGGNYWVNKNTSLTYAPSSIYFPSINNGYAVSLGQIIHTIDGGDTWLKQDSVVTAWFRSVYFVNDFTGFIAGSKGTILKTSNGGVGINEHAEKSSAIHIYPNPNPNHFTLSLPKTITSAELTIFNIIGEKVYSETFSGKEKTVDAKLREGIYFVQVRDGEGQWTQKIVVE